MSTIRILLLSFILGIIISFYKEIKKQNKPALQFNKEYTKDIEYPPSIEQKINTAKKKDQILNISKPLKIEQAIQKHEIIWETSNSLALIQEKEKLKKRKRFWRMKPYRKSKLEIESGLIVNATNINQEGLNINKIKSAIDYEDPDLRNYAVELTKKFQSYSKKHSEYRILIQSLAIFKEINSNWNYVSDPLGAEYFARASETKKHLSGDCDDHAIVMAACIKAIRGKVRLIHTKGHLYPELKIGSEDQLKEFAQIIRHELFKDSKINTPLHYHLDEDGNAWLNLDYTKQYPGGPFYGDQIYHVIE